MVSLILVFGLQRPSPRPLFTHDAYPAFCHTSPEFKFFYAFKMSKNAAFFDSASTFYLKTIVYMMKIFNLSSAF